MAERKNTRAKFCSPKCKAAARTAARRAGLAASRTGRRCANCSGPIDSERGSKSIYCSATCNVRASNRRAAAERKAARLAGRGPCRQCGEDIPDTARSDAVFCSRHCKSLYRVSTHDAGRARDLNLKFKYGIGAEGVDALLAAQEGKCAICGTSEFPGKDNRPHVDHCHTSGHVRGILCHFCNLGLGNFADDPQRLRKAAEYLER